MDTIKNVFMAFHLFFLFNIAFSTQCNIPVLSFCLAKVSFDCAFVFQQKWIICFRRAVLCSDLPLNYFLIIYLVYFCMAVHHFLCKVSLWEWKHLFWIVLNEAITEKVHPHFTIGIGYQKVGTDEISVNPALSFH